MRILMLSKACIVGAYQRKLEEIASGAPDLELIVAVPPFWKDERGVTPLERAHLTGYRLLSLPLAFNGQYHLHFYPTLGQVLREIKPDLVHIDEEPYNLATFHANVLSRRQGARTLWFSWQNLNRRYPPPFSWMEHYNLTHIDYALMGNTDAARIWQAKGYRGPLAVIPQFGVDPDLFHPAAPSQEPAPPHIAYVGRLVPEKGVDLLFQALAHLPGAWRATILGSGPEESSLKTLAQTLQIADRLEFRPPIPSTAMPQFYAGVDLLVLPSRSRPNWTEQFGRVLIEAMACEVPVIGSTCGEIPQVIEKAGRIFPEGDSAALQKELHQLIENPGYRRQLGRQGRERVLKHFTHRQIAAQTLTVYREVLESSPTSLSVSTPLSGKSTL
jgi:glycosyltransferase involved in cell wall biosynthesis